jgi:hypothetical protein
MAAIMLISALSGLSLACGHEAEAEGYELVLDNDSIAPIPVTKTYTDTVLGYFKEIRRD